MNLYRLSYLSIFNLLLIISLAVFCVFNSNQSTKYVVIEKNRLFAEFHMTKEISNDINIANNRFKVQYDSINYQFRNTRNESERVVLSEQLQSLQRSIEDLNINYREQEAAKIWKRIQSYTSDYLEENDYDMVLGTENNGDVVAFKAKLNVTEDLLIYLNKRYEGNN